MKQPKLNNLTLSKMGTKKIREMAAHSKKIKITINIDHESLVSLKNMAQKTGGSYQRILNELLKKSLDKQSGSEDRLEKLEKEIAKIKKKLAA